MNKKMDKEIEIEFVAEGRVIGSGRVFLRDSVADISDVEENLYKTLRKNEKYWLEEAAEEAKGKIIDNLTTEDEEKLKNAHAKHYTGTDDDMPDAYEDWLMDLSYDELKEILK